MCFSVVSAWVGMFVDLCVCVFVFECVCLSAWLPCVGASGREDK